MGSPFSVAPPEPQPLVITGAEEEGKHAAGELGCRLLAFDGLMEEAQGGQGFAVDVPLRVRVAPQAYAPSPPRPACPRRVRLARTGDGRRNRWRSLRTRLSVSRASCLRPRPAQVRACSQRRRIPSSSLAGSVFAVTGSGSPFPDPGRTPTPVCRCRWCTSSGARRNSSTPDDSTRRQRESRTRRCQARQ